MKYSILTYLAASAAIFAGCCETCEKGDLGDFLLDQSSDSWTAFTIGSTRFFSGSNGQEEVFTWSDLEMGLEEQLFNCDEANNCGICCETFRSGYIYSQAVSTSGVLVFNLVLKKDFIQFTPKDNPQDIEDMIVISFNNRLTCDISGLPDRMLEETVTLNGKKFNKVFSCRAEPGSYAPNSSDPVAFYFTKEDGIVGYELANNTVWNLKF